MVLTTSLFTQHMKGQASVKHKKTWHRSRYSPCLRVIHIQTDTHTCVCHTNSAWCTDTRISDVCDCSSALLPVLPDHLHMQRVCVHVYAYVSLPLSVASPVSVPLSVRVPVYL
jgi:hypothetical protein